MAVQLRVQEVAQARKITKAELSRRTGLGTTTIHELWHNKRGENVRVGTLISVASVLEVEWHSLVEITKDAPAFNDFGAGIEKTPVLALS
jgi:DNA-binding Xre family transcriptional regulator